jgi:hypothetical protein
MDENQEDIDNIEDDLILIDPTKRINYLNNKDMLKEIYKSKLSYCEFIEPKYQDYDIIVENLEDIFNLDIIEQAKANKCTKLATISLEAALVDPSRPRSPKPKLHEFKVDADTISIDELVFRVLTFEHIPHAPGRKKNPKSIADLHTKLNFYPFKHYIIKDGKAVEVGRSHSKKGKFSVAHGSITNKLAKMFLLLVNKYAQRSNWRGYSYIDEMKGQAILQLASMGLQFDENKSDNPFAYYTSIISTSFTRVLNSEKKTQDLRDDLLVGLGAVPSMSRQIAVEDEIRKLRENARYDNDPPF